MIINQTIYNLISEITNEENIFVGESLHNHTYSKLGGKADIFVTPSSYEELQQIVRLCKDQSIPLHIIGNGSKLIIKDGGLRGVVLSLKKLNKISIKKPYITAQGGASIIDVSTIALIFKLTGLEFACGIPGTVGGTIFMNAGAFDGEIKDVLDYCLVVDRDGNIVRKDAKDLEFSYRYSNIGKNGEYVIEATFKLEESTRENVRKIMEDYSLRRTTKQPLEYPSCGSVFKRPPGYFAGKLIQDSNLQGVRIGGAEVSTKHAGFIVNVDNATATDYIKLIEYVQEKVKEKFNVELEKEVLIVGEDLQI